MAITWGTQNSWRWCNKCQGLWFGPHQAASTCPEGGTHSLTGSGNYSLVHSAAVTPVNHQSGWRWCSKCQGLWFSGNPTDGRCPAGGPHSSQPSGNYFLFHKDG
jgi:hypothetical protein